MGSSYSPAILINLTNLTRGIRRISLNFFCGVRKPLRAGDMIGNGTGRRIVGKRSCKTGEGREAGVSAGSKWVSRRKQKGSKPASRRRQEGSKASSRAGVRAEQRAAGIRPSLRGVAIDVGRGGNIRLPDSFVIKKTML